MGILSRFKDIMDSNINAALDKLEDPSKLIDTYLINAKRDLASVQNETESVIAIANVAKQKWQKALKEAESYTGYAEAALAKDDEEAARKFLEEQAKAETNCAALKVAYDSAAEAETQMREMYTKLTTDIRDLETRRGTVKAISATAKAQETVNKVASTAGKTNVNSKIDDLTDKANMRLEKAKAGNELRNTPNDGLADLKSKYAPSTAAVDDNLAALKAKMNKPTE